MKQNSFTSSFKRFFFTSLFLTCILMACMLLGLEWMVRTQFESKDAYIHHMNFFLSSKAPMIAFGDSHASYAIKGKGIANLSHPGELADKSLAKLKQYMAKTTPTHVIWQADNSKIFSLPAKDDFTPMDRPYFDFPILHVLSDYHKPKLFLYLKSFLKGSTESNVQFDGVHGGVISHGTWEGKDLTFQLRDSEKEAIKNIAAYKEEGLNQASIEEYFRRLHALMDELRKKGAKICFVKYPFALRYNETLNKFPEWARAKSLWADFLNKHSYKMVDITADYAQSPELFNNADHMNPKGAGLFTHHIFKECFEKGQAE